MYFGLRLKGSGFKVHGLEVSFQHPKMNAICMFFTTLNDERETWNHLIIFNAFNNQEKVLCQHRL